MSMRSIRVAEGDDGIVAGGGAPLVLIAGPDLIESEAHALRMAVALQEIAAERGIPLVYKSSFDKANRTSIRSFRGPGLEAGLETLRLIKQECSLALATDIHEPHQAEAVAQVVDVLQIPAYLSRQTDLLVAAAATGRIVNVTLSEGEPARVQIADREVDVIRYRMTGDEERELWYDEDGKWLGMSFETRDGSIVEFHGK